MSKDVRTIPGVFYTVTMAEAGTVQATLDNGSLMTLVEVSQPGQVTFQAFSSVTVVSDDAAVVLPFRRWSSPNMVQGVTESTVRCLIEEAFYTEVEETQGTPTGTDNALFLSMEIGANYVPDGKLRSMSFRCGSNASAMTTEPFYLAIWEQTADDSEWEFVGVSTNTQVQSGNATLRWEFPEGTELHGRLIFIGGKFDRANIGTRGSEVNFRGRTSSSTDGATRLFTADHTYSFTPQLTFTYARMEEVFAPAAHPTDAVAHLTAEEHAGLTALLARKDEILAAFPETGTTEYLEPEEVPEVEQPEVEPDEVDGEAIPLDNDEAEVREIPPAPSEDVVPAPAPVGTQF